MLERNTSIKERPERFQDASEQFDAVITCEARVFEQVAQSLCRSLRRVLYENTCFVLIVRSSIHLPLERLFSFQQGCCSSGGAAVVVNEARARHQL